MRGGFPALVLALVFPVAALAQSLTDWVDRYPSEMLADKRWWAELAAVVGRDGMRRLAEDLVIEDQFALEHGWLMASGCRPHVCGEVMAGFAISLTDGHIVAVVRDDQGVTVWGKPEELPVTLAEIAAP